MATPVTLVRESPGHSSTLSAGRVRVGGVVSFTITSVVAVPGQLLLVTTRLSVKFAPHPVPAVTVTVRAFAGPEIDPLPVTDQA